MEPLRQSNGIVFVNGTHPSHRGANEKRRDLRVRFGSEIGLLIEARRLAGILDAPSWVPPTFT